MDYEEESSLSDGVPTPFTGDGGDALSLQSQPVSNVSGSVDRAVEKYNQSIGRTAAAGAAKARSQSPHIVFRRDSPFDQQSEVDSVMSASQRQSRSESRSSSFRKRDNSWDKKWVEQVKRNAPEGSKTLKAEANPGKINWSHWEKRTKVKIS